MTRLKTAGLEIHRVKKREFFRRAVSGLGVLAASQFPGSLMMADQEQVNTHANHNLQRGTYQHIKSYLNSIPSIGTHDHLLPFDVILSFLEADYGRRMGLYGLLKIGNLPRGGGLESWKSGEPFEEWWERADKRFINVRGVGFYRYMSLALRELYGVDLDHISDSEARSLDRSIFENYQSQRWLYHVITERANIELMVNDRYWARFDFQAGYPFEFLTLNVTTLVWGFHPSEFEVGSHSGQVVTTRDDPYLFARQRNLPVNSLDDYLALLDHMFVEAKQHDAVLLKTTLAYVRTLQFNEVSKQDASGVFGRPRSELSQQEVQKFEDFIMWRLVELSAKYDLPFKIHTGTARLQDSNPMLLLDMIEANPKTKFMLIHGGYPWVGETGAIGMRYHNVWINATWLPTISYTTAKRAFSEWLEVVPSNHILWGTDESIAEGLYGATELTRRCLAEVLAEKVDLGDLREEHALQIGKQILRDNALELCPRLKEKLWKHQGRLLPAE